MNTSNLHSLEITSVPANGSFSYERHWLDQLKERIENGSRGFDPRVVVSDCANAARQGKGIARGMIFSSLKSAGFGPLLGFEHLFESR